MTARSTAKRTKHSSCIQTGTQAYDRRRKRPLPNVALSDHLNQRFMDALWSNSPSIAVYIYHATEDGYAIRPMLAKWRICDDMEIQIRNTFGPGRYAIYMRKGETMLLACKLSLEAPLGWWP